MNFKTIQVRIGAPTKEQANNISNTLTKERLVAGTMILSGNSHYWWDDKVQENIYFDIRAFTKNTLKDQIIARVEELSSDICPLIAFTSVEMSKKCQDWVQKNCK